MYTKITKLSSPINQHHFNLNKKMQRTFSAFIKKIKITRF